MANSKEPVADNVRPTEPAEPDVPTAPDLKIGGSEITLQPTGYVPPATKRHQDKKNSPAGSLDSEKEEALLHTSSFRSDPFRFLREISLHVSGSGWRGYDNFIGQLILYPGFTDHIKEKVLSAKLLRDRIAELSNNRLVKEDTEGCFGTPGTKKHARLRARRQADIISGLEDVADKMIENMMVKFESKAFLRGGAYLATQLTLSAYHQGIHVSSEEVLRLRKVAEVAQAKNQSIVFLPCHRSHVDYVSLQIICFRLGLTLPTVVAGDNLNIPALGAFLQKCGAMWIRRSFGDDVLYTTMVQTYIDTLLQNGYNLECFIEGGRSRTGKLLPPKFGILSFILDSLLSGRVEDCVICPVSTQYDKVIETEGYVTELLGQPKKQENLMDFVMGGSSVLSLKYGRVDVRFHEPWSLRTFITDQLTKLHPPSSSLSSAQFILEISDPAHASMRHKMLRTLGYKVLSDINEVSVVMPTALIGTVLLTLRGRGVGKKELERRVHWLTQRIRAKGGRVAHFGNAPLADIIARGLEVLGRELVGEVRGLPEPTYYAVDRFQLSFYRNMTIHLFISEALVSVAMYTKVKQGGGPVIQDISYEELRKHVLFLSSLFRGEFIFPGDGLAANLENTLLGLENDGVIVLQRDSNSGDVLKVGLSDQERKAGRENFDFYCFLIWPFIESSWLAAVSIMGLTPPIATEGEKVDNGGSKAEAMAAGGDGQVEVWINVSEAQNSAQLLGKTLYHQGDLSYFESVNKETLKNSYQRFTEEGIVQVSKFHDPSLKGANKMVARLRLADSWIPSRDPQSGTLVAQGRLWDFTEKIAASRREGKNRRDGATVSERVLRLTDELGKALFDAAKTYNVGGQRVIGGAEIKAKKRGRRRGSLDKAKL
ncbi:Glycerol-3-phosphate acyltransferase [Ceratocystis fimbriata CBS 114723]|uniref:Glycerol-3-phosphate acyltransferase n=1 Tax=Ceratocystis fimbriata CBS 114723 TaxID=1035309 RepID=A0A2C5XD62_9PEZI|nr:Glycerol-3-phosphate acyltransferase [Ceratocystis fimbriata CBS 114723]